MTTFSDEVRETVSPHKFGGSRRAAMAHLISLNGGLDAESGNVEAPTGWFGRVGRTILYEDSAGFVAAERYHTVAEAQATFDMLDNEYCEWEGEEE